MLVLRRYYGERVIIGGNLIVEPISARHGVVTICCSRLNSVSQFQLAEQAERDLGDGITIKVVEVERGRVRLGFTAPRGVSINREEIHLKRQKECR